jgi:aryl-alcohol dehydrogenase-like predicted oxidoreductase
LLQLHTWTRAWNKNPTAFEVMRKLQKEGKIRAVGVSTPEPDQDAVNDLMKDGWVDAVQVIYNIFEQQPMAELLPVAQEKGVGIIVRVAFDEGALTGKFTEQTVFGKDDFRSRYFEGDRMGRVVARVEKIKKELGGEIGGSGYSMAQAALKFALKPEAVSTVIPGIRNVSQAEANCGVSDLPAMSEELEGRLRGHAWGRGFWYSGK